MPKPGPVPPRKPGAGALVLWRDPEALLARLNCRYGFFRWEWDLRHPQAHQDFNRAVLADPRTERDYHWLRAGGVLNAALVAGVFGMCLAAASRFVPQLDLVLLGYNVLNFGLFALGFWRLAMLVMVMARVRLPRWLMACSWVQWAVVLVASAPLTLAISRQILAASDVAASVAMWRGWWG